jgi:hypothetical protein
MLIFVLKKKTMMIKKQNVKPINDSIINESLQKQIIQNVIEVKLFTVVSEINKTIIKNI